MTPCSHPSPIKQESPNSVSNISAVKKHHDQDVCSAGKQRGGFYVQCSLVTRIVVAQTHTYSESERAKRNNAKEEPQIPYSLQEMGRFCRWPPLSGMTAWLWRLSPPPTLSPQWSVTHLACCSKMLFVVLLCGRAIWIFLETMQIEIGYQKVHLREKHLSGG